MGYFEIWVDSRQPPRKASGHDSVANASDTTEYRFVLFRRARFLRPSDPVQWATSVQELVYGAEVLKTDN